MVKILKEALIQGAQVLKTHRLKTISSAQAIMEESTRNWDLSASKDRKSTQVAPQAQSKARYQRYSHKTIRGNTDLMAVEAPLQVLVKAGTQNKTSTIVKTHQIQVNLVACRWATCLVGTQAPRVLQTEQTAAQRQRTTLILTLEMMTMMRRQMNLPATAINNSSAVHQEVLVKVVPILDQLGAPADLHNHKEAEMLIQHHR